MTLYILSYVNYSSMHKDLIREIRSYVINDEQLFFEQVCRQWKTNGIHSDEYMDILTSNRSMSQLIEIMENAEIGCKETVVNRLALQGDIKTLSCLNDQFDFVKKSECGINFAARGGSLETIRWFQGQGANTTDSTCNNAAMGGNIDIIYTLREEGIDSRKMAIWSIIGGKLDTLKILLSEGYPLSSNTIGHNVCLAAENNNIDIVKYLIEEKNQSCDISTYIQAASNGYVELMQYLLDDHHLPDYDDDIDIFCSAVRSKQYGIMDCLIEDGFPLNTSVTFLAAILNDLDMIKYLHLRNCPWDYSVYIGNLEIMQYAFDNSCQFDERSCHLVASSGNIPALELLHSFGCPFGESISRAYNSKQYETVLYLRSKGCPWPSNIHQLF